MMRMIMILSQGPLESWLLFSFLKGLPLASNQEPLIHSIKVKYTDRWDPSVLLPMPFISFLIPSSSSTFLSAHMSNFGRITKETSIKKKRSFFVFPFFIFWQCSRLSCVHYTHAVFTRETDVYQEILSRKKVKAVILMTIFDLYLIHIFGISSHYNGLINARVFE